jgi:3-hydroxyisobutyrate dehydrogenase
MKIAVLGSGKLGSVIAEACCAKGLDVTIWNRTREKAAPLVEKGAKLAERAEDALLGTDVTLSVLANTEVVLRTLGEEGVRRALVGKTLINITTTTSAEAKRIDALVRGAGAIGFLDAAIVSWPDEIMHGKGIVLLGCSEGDAGRYTSLLDTFGTVMHLGGVGSASVMELAFVMQLLIQQHIHLSTCALLNRHGLTIEPLARLLEKNTMFSSPLLAVYNDFLRTRKYAPAVMTTEHYVHVLDLVIEEVEDAGMDASIWLSSLKLAKEAIATQGADADWTSVYEALR